MQTTESPADVEAHGYTQPMIVYNKAKQSASLMADGRLLFQMGLEEAVPTFLASFYVFKIKFTNECSNRFYCLDYIFFKEQPPKDIYRVKLKTFLNKLD